MVNATAENTVHIIVLSEWQDDGSFRKVVQGVWASIDSARAELQRIAKSFNSGAEHVKNWRAVVPLNQRDDLSVQLLVGKLYECRLFYSIKTHQVLS